MCVYVAYTIDWLFYFARIARAPLNSVVLCIDLYYVFARSYARIRSCDSYSVRELARDTRCNVTHTERYGNVACGSAGGAREEE